MPAHLKWPYPQMGQGFAAASHVPPRQTAWRASGSSRAAFDATHQRGGRWPIRENSRVPYRTLAIGVGLRPCWPSDSRAWSSTADGSGCAGQDRTVGGSSGTYVVGNRSACKPLSDRPAVWKTSRINRRRPREEDRKRKGRRALRWNGGKKNPGEEQQLQSGRIRALSAWRRHW